MDVDCGLLGYGVMMACSFVGGYRSVVLNVYQTRRFTVGNENGLRVLEIRMLGRLLGPNRKRNAGKMKVISCIEELHNFHYAPTS
jgi:hypothetical protein